MKSAQCDFSNISPCSEPPAICLEWWIEREIKLSTCDQSREIQVYLSPEIYPLQKLLSPSPLFSPLCKHRLYNELIAHVAGAQTRVLGHDSFNVRHKRNSSNKSPA